MQTLTEITHAVRRNQQVNPTELRYAVAAYDVLIAKLNVSQDQEQVKEFFKAAESDPREYIGWSNDPENPEARDWHQRTIAAGDAIDLAASKCSGDCGECQKRDVVAPAPVVNGCGCGGCECPECNGR